ncbi:MAG: hypothetical protein AB1726_13055 [Planctomycetota bacterium]
MAEPPRLEISPFCAWLRSKRYYFLDRPPRDESEVLDGSQSCWCELTQEAVGRDGKIVDPRDCRDGRSCFQPYGTR